MDSIFKEANQRFDIRSVVERYAHATFVGNQCRCPFHDDSTPSLTIYPDTNSFHCFGCQASGDCVGFVARLKGIKPIEALELLNAEYGNVATKSASLATKKKDVKTPDEIRTYIEKCKVAVGKTDYFQKRGLTAETIRRFSLGYDEKYNSIVYPYNRRFSFYQSRRISPKDGEPKFYKPPTADGEPIFNEDELPREGHEPIFVVESPICAMSIIQCGFRAVATCGGSGVNKFAEKLKGIKSKPSFIISLDNDDKGPAFTKELTVLLTKENIKYIVRVVSGGEKDPNDLLQKDKAGLEQNLASARAEFAKRHSRIGDLISMADLEKTKFPPREWFLKGLMSNGLYLLAAPPKFGKSFLALDMCLSIARGKPCLGFETVKRGVLYMVLEDRLDDFKDRTKRYLGDESFPANMFLCDKDEYRLKEITNDDSLINYFDELLAWGDPIQFIVIDTFQHIRGEMQKNEGIYNFDRRELRYLKKFADEKRICILLIHHTRKSKDEDNEFNEVSGSAALQGGVDAVFKIKKQKVADTDATFSALGRGIRIEPFTMHFDDEKFRWVKIGNEQERATQRALEEYRNSPYRKVILGLMKDHGGSWQGTMSDFAIQSQRYLIHSLPAVQPAQLSKELSAINHYLSEIDGIVHLEPKTGGRTGRIHDFHLKSKGGTQEQMNTS